MAGCTPESHNQTTCCRGYDYVKRGILVREFVSIRPVGTILSETLTKSRCMQQSWPGSYHIPGQDLEKYDFRGESNFTFPVVTLRRL